MRAFANFVLRGRIQAILVVTLSAALTMVLPLLSHIGGGVLSLVTLRNGFREGLLIAMVSALVLALVGYMSALDSGMVNLIVGSMVMMVWAPVLLASHVLRATRSVALALASAGGLAGAGMVLFYLSVGDATAWWRNILDGALLPLLEQFDGQLMGDDSAMLLDNLSRLMTGVLAATMVFTAMANLCIGRWLQAVLFNPGGFAAEFRTLYLGTSMGVISVLMLVLASFTGGVIGNFALNMMFLIGAMYSLHGLALVHAIVKQTNAHYAWLVGLYILILFALPQVALALAAAGFSDSWMNFRARISGKGGPPPSAD